MTQAGTRKNFSSMAKQMQTEYEHFLMIVKLEMPTVPLCRVGCSVLGRREASAKKRQERPETRHRELVIPDVETLVPSSS